MCVRVKSDKSKEFFFPSYSWFFFSAAMRENFIPILYWKKIKKSSRTLGIYYIFFTILEFFLRLFFLQIIYFPKLKTSISREAGVDKIHKWVSLWEVINLLLPYIPAAHFVEWRHCFVTAARSLKPGALLVSRRRILPSSVRERGPPTTPRTQGGLPANARIRITLACRAQHGMKYFVINATQPLLLQRNPKKCRRVWRGSPR